MTYEQAKEIAYQKRFGPRAFDILFAASCGLVNPYAYFGNTLRRSWSYAYFSRLYSHGLLKQIKTPEGCRGHHWYALAD